MRQVKLGDRYRTVSPSLKVRFPVDEALAAAQKKARAKLPEDPMKPLIRKSVVGSR